MGKLGNFGKIWAILGYFGLLDNLVKFGQLIAALAQMNKSRMLPLFFWTRSVTEVEFRTF